MKRYRTQRLSQRRKGSTLALLAILLPATLILAGFAINVAYIELARTEARISTDAAARAAGKTYVMTGDETIALRYAQTAAGKNPIANRTHTVAVGDLEFGRSTRISGVRYSFTPNTATKNAVRVTADFTDTGSSAIPLLMPVMPSRSSFEVYHQAISTQVEADIALILDRSGSMAYASDEPAIYPPIPAAADSTWDFCQAAPTPSRWRDTLTAVDAFIVALNASPQRELLSICTYNDGGTRDLNLTDDYTLVAPKLDVYTQAFCAGETNIGGGLAVGINALKATGSRFDAAKVLILMTDGIHTTGQDPLAVAQTAADGGYSIFTITFSDEANITSMKAVAAKAGGKHFHATTGAELTQVFQDIARNLPVLLTE